MKNSKNIALYVAALLAVSIITGFIYGMNNPIELTDYLESLNNNNSLFVVQILTIIGLFFSTLSLINLLLESIIFGIEGISIGYTISLFVKNYKLNGALYGLITILVNKGIYLLILLYLFIISYHYISKVFRNIVGLNNDYINISIKPLIKKYLVILFIAIINDTVIYFFGNIFLNYLTFML